jgi:hypothetical protein
VPENARRTNRERPDGEGEAREQRGQRAADDDGQRRDRLEPVGRIHHEGRDAPAAKRARGDGHQSRGHAQKRGAQREAGEDAAPRRAERLQDRRFEHAPALARRRRADQDDEPRDQRRRGAVGRGRRKAAQRLGHLVDGVADADRGDVGRVARHVAQDGGLGLFLGVDGGDMGVRRARQRVLRHGQDEADPGVFELHLAQGGDGRGDVAAEDVDGDLVAHGQADLPASSAAKATSGGPS